jgi:peptide/nickel transport system substrate-binding protein
MVIGSTDPIISLDPAGSYDKGSWSLINNVFTGLLRSYGDKLEPELAESCTFSDDLTYNCKLRDHLQFANGHPLTSKDVKYSIDRMLKIKDSNGPSSLYENIASVTADNPLSVTFKLREVDSVLPYKLSLVGAAIVDPSVYPADKLLANNQLPVGAGAYKLTNFKDRELATFRSNQHYVGHKASVSDVLVKYYAKNEQMKNDLQNGNLDLVMTGLSPRDIESLKKKHFNFTTSPTGLTTYLAFNAKLVSLPIRQAIAYLIDRDQIASQVYFNTVKPQYTMVTTVPGFSEFKDRYGQVPSVDAARNTMTRAGLKLPYPIEVWWTPSHYGPNSGDEYLTIKRQLEASGLFTVNLKSTEWSNYLIKEHNNEEPIYQMGWNVDYTDPEDDLAPFFGDEQFLELGQTFPQVQALLKQYLNPMLSQEQKLNLIRQIVPIIANNAPLIPIWHQGTVTMSDKKIKGVQEATTTVLLDFNYLEKNV